MVHVVTSARTAVRAALETAMPTVTWHSKRIRVDTSQLPMGVIYTPRVLTERFDADEVSREVEIAVVLKREGGDDLDDILDDDTASIETSVLPVLEGLSHDWDLVETTTDIDFAAKVPVGTVQMQFRVVLLTDYATPTV